MVARPSAPSPPSPLSSTDQRHRWCTWLACADGACTPQRQPVLGGSGPTGQHPPHWTAFPLVQPRGRRLPGGTSVRRGAPRTPLHPAVACGHRGAWDCSLSPPGAPRLRALSVSPLPLPTPLFLCLVLRRSFSLARPHSVHPLPSLSRLPRVHLPNSVPLCVEVWPPGTPCPMASGRAHCSPSRG